MPGACHRASPAHSALRPVSPPRLQVRTQAPRLKSGRAHAHLPPRPSAPRPQIPDTRPVRAEASLSVGTWLATSLGRSPSPPQDGTPPCQQPPAGPCGVRRGGQSSVSRWPRRRCRCTWVLRTAGHTHTLSGTAATAAPSSPPPPPGPAAPTPLQADGQRWPGKGRKGSRPQLGAVTAPLLRLPLLLLLTPDARLVKGVLFFLFRRAD